jgi:hypothetical protein
MLHFLLTRRSVITCIHGGMVTHIPKSFSGELINGELLMLLTDEYPIVGCPNRLSFGNESVGSPCIRVEWMTASTIRLIGGVPVLTHTSTGLCYSAGGAAQGPPIILTFQTVEAEEGSIDSIIQRAIDSAKQAAAG